MAIGSAITERDSAGMMLVEDESAAASDHRLLKSFAGRRDQAAFAILVRRHGPMVLGVCRQVLGNGHDAEDAFQVTFMVLARKAGSIRRPELLGAWLHGVALRTARKARELAARRRDTRSLEETMPQASTIVEEGLQELRLQRSEQYRLLHEEIARLPERYQVPIVLCYLHGRSHVEAARCLDCPPGTISVRLMRARELLRSRLARRGLGPVAGLLTATTLVETARAEVPASLARATVRAGVRFASGLDVSASASATVPGLAHAVLTGLAQESFIAAAGVLSIVAGLVLAIGTVMAVVGGAGREPARPAAAAPRPLPTRPAIPLETTELPSRLPADRQRPAAPGDLPIRRRESSPPGAPGATAEVLDEYRHLAAEAVGDADAQVRLAIWCEARGLKAERTRHLSMAVSLEPDHAKARGLLGLVAYRGRWRSPQAVLDQVRTDPELNARLYEYQERRERTLLTVDSQWKLARWCEQNGLRDEMTAHLRKVVQLDPGHEGAWKRLGFKKYNGRWLPEDTIASEQAQAEARKKADRLWTPVLTRLRAWLDEPERRDEAERRLAAISDPAAVPAIWSTFASRRRSDQAALVRLLGQIDSPQAARMLGVLAFASSWDEVRRAACETLSRRDHREVISFLVSRLRDPEPPKDATLFRYFWTPTGSTGIGSPGITYIEGRHANVLRTYTVDEVFLGRYGGPNYEGRVWRQRIRQLEEFELIVTGFMTDALREFASRSVPIREVNNRMMLTLKNITGLDKGDWDAWAKWWVEELGYSYEPSDFATPPDLDWYAPKPTYVSNAHFSCFGAGTLVHTLSGPRPIESVRTGDRLLSQDVSTGALEYAPVLSVFHNEPAPTLRITLDGSTVVATGIHRFWKAGQGWVMARDLNAGDLIRTVDGVVRVSGVSTDAIQPVFNLLVGEHQSFFVGRDAVLVHDNSLVAPVADRFDDSLEFRL